MISLQLTDAWDLAVDGSGNLAVTDGKARIAQDVACAERTFLGEAWYAKDEGVPYHLRELGARPPDALVIARADARALQVPGVAAASTTLAPFDTHDGRTLTGTIRIVTDQEETVYVAI